MNLAAVHKKTGIVEFFLHDERSNPPRFFEDCDHLRWVELSDDCTEEVTAQLVPIRLVSHYLYPPIPIRSMDWGVCIEGEEERGYQSYGATEGEALSDFIRNYEP